MSRLSRRRIRAWLAPMRRAFAQIRTGECDALRGYPVTRTHGGSDYVRIDVCCAGFRPLLNRLCPALDTSPLERVEKKLAAGVLLQAQEVDAVFVLFNRAEDLLIKRTRDEIQDAVMIEQIGIELEQAGVIGEAA